MLLAGDVSLSLGDIEAFQSRTATFDVLVDNPMAKGITLIQNQATVTSNEFAAVTSDPVDTTIDRAPQVTDVYVRGTAATGVPAWAPGFLTALQTDGLGDSTFGYRIPDGVDQLEELSWVNINTITFRFSENVSVAFDDLQLFGTDVGNYTLDNALFTSSGNTATWQLDNAANPVVGTDKIRAVLDASGTGITDAAGNQRLDGEWIDATAVFPTGDGAEGTNFSFRFNVSAGDGNRDGGTSTADLTNVTQLISSGGYDRHFDVNADNGISSADRTNIIARIVTVLPTAEPGGTAGTGWIDNATPEPPLGPGSTGNITAAKTAMLIVDNDGDGMADPGDTIRYTVTVNNGENSAMTGVMLDDCLSTHLSFVASSDNVSPYITSTITPSVPENTTLATDVESTDPDGETENGGGLTYSLTTLFSGGVDNSFFILDTDTGELNFDSPPNFESPMATNAPFNTYETQITVTDAGGLTNFRNILVTVTDVVENTAPMITSGATANFAENASGTVLDVMSNDDNDTEGGGGLTYSFSSTGVGPGIDNGDLNLDANTGELTFMSPPDFETPTDNNMDNDYLVQVTVTDSGPGTPLTDVQNITITVTDVAEVDAIDDSFAGIIGNVGLNVPAGNGVLSNDLGGATTVTQVNGVGANVGSATATAHGTVTVQANGSFVYEPNAGNLTADSFTYEADGADTATVNLTFGTDVIWFVDSTPSGTGNVGTLSDPFNSISAYNSGAAANQRVFTAQGGYTGPLNLQNNTLVIGQGATGTTATLLGVTEPTDSRMLPSVGGTAPSITSATNGINLASGNTIRGMAIGNTTGTGINGGAVGTLTISDTTINGTGNAINVSTSGTLAVSFDTLSAFGPSTGISLSGVSGTFTATGGSITNATSRGVDLNSVSATFTYPGSISTTAAGRSVEVTNSGSTSAGGNIITFSGAIDDNGLGINLNNNDQNTNGATINFAGGLALDTGSNTAFTATNGGTVNTTGTNTIGANTVSTTTAINVANTTIGASNLNFETVNVNGGGVGIVLNNTGAAGGLKLGANGTSADDGGVFQNLTNAMTLTLTSDVAMNRVRFENITGDGVTGDRVTDGSDAGDDSFEVTNSVFEDIGTSASADDVFDFFSANMTANTFNISGDVTFTGNAFNEDAGGARNAWARTAINIQNQDNVTMNLLVDNTTFANTPTNGDGAIKVLGGEGSTHGVDIQDSSAIDVRGELLFLTTEEFGTSANVDFFRNEMRRLTSTGTGVGGLTIGGGVSLNATNQSRITFDIQDNCPSSQTGCTSGDATAGFYNLFGDPITAAINGTTGQSNVTSNEGRVNKNRIEDSTARNIVLFNDGNGARIASTVQVNNNTVLGGGNGVDLVWRESPDVTVGAAAADRTWNLTITNNTLGTVANPLVDDGIDGLDLNGDSSGGGAPSPNPNGVFVFLVEGNSIVTNSGSAARFDIEETGIADITVRNNPLLRTNDAGTSAHALEIKSDLNTTMDSSISGNSLTSNGSSNIELDRDDTSSTLNVLQTSSANLTSVNNGASVNISDEAINFNSGITPSTPTLPGNPLMAQGNPEGEATRLSDADLAMVFNGAIARWMATGLTNIEVELLNDATYEIIDLGNSEIGRTFTSDVMIDINAAGHGWFVDSTPWDDVEFSRLTARTERIAMPTSDAFGRVDLLTVVMHELGHVIGRAHSNRPHSLMSDTLPTGTRRLLTPAQTAVAEAEPEEIELSGPPRGRFAGASGSFEQIDLEQRTGAANMPMNTIRVNVNGTGYFWIGDTSSKKVLEFSRRTTRIERSQIQFDKFFGDLDQSDEFEHLDELRYFDEMFGRKIQLFQGRTSVWK